MTAKKKSPGRRGAYTITLGEEKVRKIRRFRSLEDPEGTRLTTLDQVMNLLIDRQLEAERV